MFGWWDVLNAFLVIAYPAIGSFVPLSVLFQEAPLYWWIGLPILLLCIAGIKLQRRLDKYETPVLEIVFDDRYCFQMYQAEIVLFLVGIRNNSGVDILEAELVLKEIIPKPLNSIPMPLNPKDAPRNSPSCFSVPRSAEPIKFVEVFEWDKSTNLFHIHYYANYLAAEAVEKVMEMNGREAVLSTRRSYPYILSPNSYELTLLLTGKTKQGIGLKPIETKCKITYDKEKNLAKLQPFRR